MVRFEINKTQLKQNFADAFWRMSWIYMVLFVVGAAVGAVGLVFGIGKNVGTLIIGIAAIVMAALSLAMVGFQFATLHIVFFGKFKENYPNGVKIFEIERTDAGYDIHNVVNGSRATLHHFKVAKIIKTKRSILLKLRQGTMLGFPRSEELDKIFY